MNVFEIDKILGKDKVNISETEVGIPKKKLFSPNQNKWQLKKSIFPLVFSALIALFSPQ